jgi:hypothetical protein
VVHLGHGRRTGILLHQAQPEQQLQPVRMALEGVLDLVEEGVQPLRGIGARHLDGRQGRQQGGPGALQHGDVDPVLAAEVPVEGTDRQAARGGDHRDGRGCVTVLGHQVAGGVEYRVA